MLNFRIEGEPKPEEPITLRLERGSNGGVNLRATKGFHTSYLLKITSKGELYLFNWINPGIGLPVTEMGEGTLILTRDKYANR